MGPSSEAHSVSEDGSGRDRAISLISATGKGWGRTGCSCSRRGSAAGDTRSARRSTAGCCWSKDSSSTGDGNLKPVGDPDHRGEPVYGSISSITGVYSAGGEGGSPLTVAGGSTGSSWRCLDLFSVQDFLGRGAAMSMRNFSSDLVQLREAMLHLEVVPVGEPPLRTCPSFLCSQWGFGGCVDTTGAAQEGPGEALTVGDVHCPADTSVPDLMAHVGT